MVPLTLFLAASAAAPAHTLVTVQATATVSIVRPVTISASALSSGLQNWREITVRHRDGTVEQVRVIEFQ